MLVTFFFLLEHLFMNYLCIILIILFFRDFLILFEGDSCAGMAMW